MKFLLKPYISIFDILCLITIHAFIENTIIWMILAMSLGLISGFLQGKFYKIMKK